MLTNMPSSASPPSSTCSCLGGKPQSSSAESGATPVFSCSSWRKPRTVMEGDRSVEGGRGGEQGQICRCGGQI